MKQVEKESVHSLQRLEMRRKTPAGVRDSVHSLQRLEMRRKTPAGVRDLP
jgi:primosomal replication protein N